MFRYKLIIRSCGMTILLLLTSVFSPAICQTNEALADYQKALQLDPKLYHAALFCGDVSMQKGDYNQAEIWYQKAITIDPLKETAYRYSATPLMKQGKTGAARDRYVEPFIVEPYSRFARAG